MKNKFLFILFIFTMILPLKTFAYENYNTSYNITIPDYKTQLEGYTCGNTNMYDLFNYIISQVDFSTSYYQLYSYIPDSGYKLNAYLIPTSRINNDTDSRKFGLFPRGTKLSSGSSQYWYFNFLERYDANALITFSLNTCPSDLDVINSTFISDLINYIQSNTTPTSYSNQYIGNISVSSYSIPAQPRCRISTPSNSNNIDADCWYYYNSYKAIYPDVSQTSSSSYYKKVHLVNENKDYMPGDYLDSYLDLYPPNSTNDFIQYQSELNTFYSNMNPSDFSNYTLSFSFSNISPINFIGTPLQDIADSLSFETYCSGRINNTNYYEYESFNCSITDSYSISNNRITYNFTNLSTTHTLTNYDKVFVSIRPIYNNNIVRTIYNLYFNSSSRTINSTFLGTIYDNFQNLPLNFQLMFSSNNNNLNSLVSIYDYKNKGVRVFGYDNSNNFQYTLGESILVDVINGTDRTQDRFISFNVSNDLNQKVIISQLTNDSNNTINNFELFFYNGIVISFDSNQSNDFYYIDSNGDIDNSNFDIPIANDNKYNIDSYFDIVNDFIDSLNSDILEFSTLIQNTYDSLPIFLQTFLYVIFILCCVYFTYLLIKR